MNTYMYAKTYAKLLQQSESRDNKHVMHFTYLQEPHRNHDIPVHMTTISALVCVVIGSKTRAQNYKNEHWGSTTETVYAYTST